MEIKRFFYFSLLQGDIEVWTFEKIVNSIDFIHLFSEFWLKFRKFCENLIKIFKKMLILFLFVVRQNILSAKFIDFFVTNSG